MTAASPIVYAHRGASAELPENTLEAFERALSRGADALETDAHATRDGVVVLVHDPTGTRTARDPRRVSDLTRGEIARWDVGGGRRVPLLEEALEAFPTTFFNVDAKEERGDMMPALVRTIRRASAEARVRLASFSQANLDRARALGYRGPLALGRRDLVLALASPPALGRRLVAHADRAQVPPRAHGFDFTKPWVLRRLHALGLGVDLWTIDDPAEAVALVLAGVDGIITNDPARVVEALAFTRRGALPEASAQRSS